MPACGLAPNMFSSQRCLLSSSRHGRWPAISPKPELSRTAAFADLAPLCRGHRLRKLYLECALYLRRGFWRLPHRCTTGARARCIDRAVTARREDALPLSDPHPDHAEGRDRAAVRDLVRLRYHLQDRGGGDGGVLPDPGEC